MSVPNWMLYTKTQPCDQNEYCIPNLQSLGFSKSSHVDRRTLKGYSGHQIFVQGLSPGDARSVPELFEEFGRVRDIKVDQYWISISYFSAAAATEAWKAMNGIIFEGKECVVHLTEPDITRGRSHIHDAHGLCRQRSRSRGERAIKRRVRSVSPTGRLGNGMCMDVSELKARQHLRHRSYSFGTLLPDVESE